MRLIKKILNSVLNIIIGVELIICASLFSFILYMENFSQLAYENKTREIYKEIWSKTGQSQDSVPLYIVTSSQENAYTDGTKVVIYTALINNSRSWDEVALVLGHEIAHVNLGHLGKLNTSVTNEIAVLEGNADKMGAFYMIRAGYDVCKGRMIYKRWLNTSGNYLGQNHPNYSYRYDELNVNCD